MIILAMLSQKGGSGKTTLAIHAATEAETRGLKTLLIDLDPQASATLWADQRGDRLPKVVSEHPARLERALADARSAGFDLVVLDTAPHADQAALRAAKLADIIVVPCRPAFFDIGSMRFTLDACELARRTPVVVINGAPLPRSRIIGETRAEIEKLGGVVSAHIIRQLVAYQHCLISGDTAAEYEPNGAAAREFAVFFDSVLPA